MKNVDSLLKAELEKLGVPVERLKYGGKAACFIVYQLVVGRDTFFSDDEEGAQEFTYQVHVYSKTDYIDILQRLKTALKAAGFYAITIDAETYEQDTGYAKTGAGAERTDGIQCDCESERPCKAHLHDHEFDGALPEEIPLHACKQDTG